MVGEIVVGAARRQESSGKSESKKQAPLRSDEARKLSGWREGSQAHQESTNTKRAVRPQEAKGKKQSWLG